jgi:sulfopyruvate decarboxylase subunit beta
LRRSDAIAFVSRALPVDTLVVACNGFVGRELHDLGDQPRHFYMIGSMGLASSIGLGLALKQPRKRVVVLDGDGNVLMGMGALANVAEQAPPNLYHVVFDNGVHSSTGGQRTVSRTARLDDIAQAAGYRWAVRVADETVLVAAVDALLAEPGPSMLVVEVDVSDEDHAAGRVAIDPPALAERFREAAGGSAMGPLVGRPRTSSRRSPDSR